MFHYPINFSFKIKDLDSSNLIVLDSNQFNVSADIPVEFNGQGRSLSPEDYYMFSLVTCFFTTFLKLSSQKNIDFKIKNIGCVSVLDRGEDSKPFVKNVTLNFDFSSNSSVDFKRLVDFTKDNCFILNSVKTNFIIDINEIHESI